MGKRRSRLRSAATNRKAPAVSKIGPLIGRDLRPSVGSRAQEGAVARPGAESEELRSLAAEQLALVNGGDPERAGRDIDSAGWAVSADVLEAAVDDELVLLDPVAGTYFGVNESGTAIWRGLREGRSAADVARELVERFEVNPERARADVDRFVARLGSAGLMRKRREAPGRGRIR